MRRREFITLLGSAAAWPIAARAQPADRMRRIGVLSGLSLDDSESKARIAAFLGELARLGWNEGRNIRLDVRSGGANAAERRKNAAELVALAPDIILAIGSISVEHLLEVTHSVPIVFTIVADPVGGGYVGSLAQPGGNATGFMMFEYSLSGKWLELLKEVAPGLRRAAVLRESRLPAGIGQFAVIQAVAPSLGVDVRAIGLQDPAEIERAIAAFAQAPDGGLIVTAGPSSVVHRELIIRLAAQHKLPAIYIERFFAAAGGLVSYGPNFVDQTRQAATYVDRILKGEKLADLPVQEETIGMLVHPNTPTTEAERRDVQAAARAIGQQLVIEDVRSDRDIEPAFAALARRGASALLVGSGPFLNSHAKRIVALVARHALPTIYFQREAVVAGGLMSYGTSITDGYRQAGGYAGRILKGEKPADLPVVQSTKFELALNLQTAKALNLAIPDRLLALADEVIE
jgi:putative tryptophan/tyrosine transport system substrate-binding protein